MLKLFTPQYTPSFHAESYLCDIKEILGEADLDRVEESKNIVTLATLLW